MDGVLVAVTSLLACNKEGDVNIYVGGMALLGPGLLHWIQFLEVLPY